MLAACAAVLRCACACACSEEAAVHTLHGAYGCVAQGMELNLKFTAPKGMELNLKFTVPMDAWPKAWN